MSENHSSYDNNLRRWFHFLSISLLSLVYGLTGLTWHAVLPILSIFTLIFISLDLIRNHVGFLNSFVQNTFSFILRKHEFYTISGMSWFLIAALISITIFPKIAAVLGFMYLAVGDPAASYFGIKFGNTKVGTKSWVGTFAFFFFSWLIGTLWLWVVLLPFSIATIVATISAAVAAAAEREVSEMDDNLVIPLIASTFISFMLFVV